MLRKCIIAMQKQQVPKIVIQARRPVRSVGCSFSYVFLISCLVCKMSENGEKYPPYFSRFHDDVFRSVKICKGVCTYVLYTTVILLLPSATPFQLSPFLSGFMFWCSSSLCALAIVRAQNYCFCLLFSCWDLETGCPWPFACTCQRWRKCCSFL